MDEFSRSVEADRTINDFEEQIMEAYANHPIDTAHALRANLQSNMRDVNWYQVAVVAIATFAIAMDLMFPPVKVAIGQSLALFAGHLYAPWPAAGAAQVNFAELALELLAIVALAALGWHAITRAGAAPSRA
jgi:hypothetical protein